MNPFLNFLFKVIAYTSCLSLILFAILFYLIEKPFQSSDYENHINKIVFDDIYKREQLIKPVVYLSHEEKKQYLDQYGTWILNINHTYDEEYEQTPIDIDSLTLNLINRSHQGLSALDLKSIVTSLSISELKDSISHLSKAYYPLSKQSITYTLLKSLLDSSIEESNTEKREALILFALDLNKQTRGHYSSRRHPAIMIDRSYPDDE